MTSNHPEPVVDAEKLLEQLRAMAAKAQAEGEPAVAVGYTAANALALHENVAMSWKGLSRDPRIRRIEQGGDPLRARPRPRKREPKGRFWDPQGRGQSKFLETPLREQKSVLVQIVIDMLRGGKTMAQALLAAGLRLQRESQQLVPVDTGNTKASAFTRLEQG